MCVVWCVHTRTHKHTSAGLGPRDHAAAAAARKNASIIIDARYKLRGEKPVYFIVFNCKHQQHTHTHIRETTILSPQSRDSSEAVKKCICRFCVPATESLPSPCSLKYASFSLFCLNCTLKSIEDNFPLFTHLLTASHASSSLFTMSRN